MIRKRWKTLLASSLVTVAPIAFGLIMWNRLPERIATHWGMNGEADGWSSRPFAVLFIPLFLLAMHWLCVLFTSLDPKNKEGNDKALSIAVWMCPFLSVLVNAFVYAAALGKEWKISAVMPLFMGVLFAVVGRYLPKYKQNHTIGIRLPWTLDDEENWDATHRFGGKVWVIGGLLVAVCALLPEAVMVWVMMSLLVLMVIIPTVYSYRYYKNHKE